MKILTERNSKLLESEMIKSKNESKILGRFGNSALQVFWFEVHNQKLSTKNFSNGFSSLCNTSIDGTKPVIVGKYEF